MRLQHILHILQKSAYHIFPHISAFRKSHIRKYANWHIFAHASHTSAYATAHFRFFLAFPLVTIDRIVFSDASQISGIVRSPLRLPFAAYMRHTYVYATHNKFCTVSHIFCIQKLYSTPPNRLAWPRS